VEGTKPGLDSDPTRKPEIVWPELINRVNLHLALGGSFEEDAEKQVVESAEE
jgi:hypothetical protein